jgi:hypothetical protein
MNENMEVLMEEYIKTCRRYEIEELPTNPYMKKPYLERTLFDFYMEYHDEELEKKICENMIHREMNEDDLFMIYWIYPYLKKKNFRDFWEKNKNQPSFKVFIEKCFIWIIHYFQFYMICTELLYIDTKIFKDELEILYSPSKMKKYIHQHLKKKDVLKRFIFLHNEIIDLQKDYDFLFYYICNIFSLKEDASFYFSEFAFHSILLSEKKILPYSIQKKKWFSKKTISPFLCMSNFTE